MSKYDEDSALRLITVILNLCIMVGVGCPITLYFMYKGGMISPNSLAYIFLPGYMLMLIIIVIFRLAVSASINDEVKKNESRK
jgi:hypothetical protein